VLPQPDYVTDGTIAMIAALALLLTGTIQWTVVQTLPWHVIFILGGGGALSNGIVTAGVAETVTELLKASAQHTSVLLLLIVMCSGAMALSNVMSNVAAAEILLATLPCFAVELGHHPLVSAVTVHHIYIHDIHRICISASVFKVATCHI
jgi:solute carrier family 13 (sodium-dependent dicarboxylate transporter), member 2/3/5